MFADSKWTFFELSSGAMKIMLSYQQWWATADLFRIRCH